MLDEVFAERAIQHEIQIYIEESTRLTGQQQHSRLLRAYDVSCCRSRTDFKRLEEEGGERGEMGWDDGRAKDP